MDQRNLSQAELFAAAGKQLLGALEELDAKVKLCKQLGYPMPEGNNKRSEWEIDLLELAERLLYAPDEDARARAYNALAAAINDDK